MCNAWFFLFAKERSVNMQKLMEKQSVLRTKLTASADGSRTYSIVKTIEGATGGKGICDKKDYCILPTGFCII